VENACLLGCPDILVTDLRIDDPDIILTQKYVLTSGIEKISQGFIL
jgi:hypothetical protein